MRALGCLRSSVYLEICRPSLPFSPCGQVHNSEVYAERRTFLTTRFAGRVITPICRGYISRRSLFQSSCPRGSAEAVIQAEDEDTLIKDVRVEKFKEDVQRSLIVGDYQGLFRAFQFAAEYPELIQSIPDNTFTEILTLLAPKNALGWIKTHYFHLSPVMIKRLRLPSADKLVREHLWRATDIVQTRQAVGSTLSIKDYSIILGFARWAGVREVADAIWKSMQTEEIVPDLKCYNNYMGAIVSNRHLDPTVRHNRHLTPFRIRMRSEPTGSVKSSAYKFGAGGIKEEVMNIHRQMLESDVAADEETFRIMILGVAREGDLDAVKKIMRQVWQVDVDAVVDGSIDYTSMPLTELDPTSPLYPSPYLLFSIAHAFGINNDIPTALQLVEYMSRTFRVEIFDYVWQELFNWTFVLSLPRRASQGDVAHLPKPSVQKVWNMMVNEPYNVRPTLDMYNKLVKSLFVQQRTRDMWHYMYEALPLYEEACTKAHRRYQSLRNALGRSRRGRYINVPVEKVRQRYEKSKMLQQISRLWLKRWVRLLLASMRSWHILDKNRNWSQRRIPCFVLDWKDFMPGTIWYDIRAGRVEIQLRSPEEKLQHQQEIKRVIETRSQYIAQHADFIPGHVYETYEVTGRVRRRAIHDQRKLEEQQRSKKNLGTIWYPRRDAGNAARYQWRVIDLDGRPSGGTARLARRTLRKVRTD